MIGTFNRRLYKLTSLNKKMCENRDALSLFFDVSDNNMIRVHRQFFIHNQYRQFLLSPIINIDSLDLKETINEISYEGFVKLLNQLISTDHRNSDEYLFFSELREKMGNGVVINAKDDIEIENAISSINNIFAKYYYSINDKTFYKDIDNYDAANGMCNYSAYDYDDFNEECKPEVFINDDELSLYEFRIYNVGQANCSALIKYVDEEHSDYKIIVVFDFGYKKKRNNQSLDEMIKRIDENTTMVISHFHSDHINIITNHLMMHTNRWVFPDYPPTSVIGNKIFTTLLKVARGKTSSGILYRFPTPFNFSDNLTIDQYSGITKGDAHQSSLMNSKSLTCKLSIGNKDILIPGDALYEEIGDGLILKNNKKYDYILIPHHGCKYFGKSSIDPTLKIRCFVGDETVGYVQCGKNSYGHANINHLSWYSEINSFDHSNFYDDFKNVVKTSPKTAFDYYSIGFN